MLYKSGKLAGTRKRYPLSVYNAITKTETEVQTQDELIEMVWEMFSRTKNEKKTAEQILYEDVLWNFGIQEDEEITPINLIDRRTEALIEDYLYYRNNPTANRESRIWKEAFILLDKILQVRLF